jgi:hypothetical protein
MVLQLSPATPNPDMTEVEAPRAQQESDDEDMAQENEKEKKKKTLHTQQLRAPAGFRANLTATRTLQNQWDFE